MLQRSKVGVVTAYRDVTVYRAWLSYRELHILKRYLFHLAPYLKQSTLFPGNFVQIESEPTENGDLSEINTSLRGNLSSKYLLKRYFITTDFALEDLDVLNFPLSSILKKTKFAEKERVGIRRDRTGTTGLRIPWLTTWTICELTNAGGKRSLKSLRSHARTTGTSTAVPSACYTHRREEKHLSKIS